MPMRCFCVVHKEENGPLHPAITPPRRFAFGPKALQSLIKWAFWFSHLSAPHRVLRSLPSCSPQLLRPHCWIWLTMLACVLPFQQILPGGEKPFWNMASVRTPQRISYDTVCLKPFSEHGLSVLSQEFLPSQMNHLVQINTREEGCCPEIQARCCPST